MRSGGDQQAALRYLFHDCGPPTQDWALGTRRLFNPGPPVYPAAAFHDLGS
jgi:hypothetical protein